MQKALYIGIAASFVLGASAFAQTAPSNTTQPAGMTGPAPASPPSTGNGAISTSNADGMPAKATGTIGNAAAGNDNQAVATTSANAASPAHGANSFTAGEARKRIASSGFSDVSGLEKGSDGVWHGHAKKNGTQVSVWLDYKGNVGQR